MRGFEEERIEKAFSSDETIESSELSRCQACRVPRLGIATLVGKRSSVRANPKKLSQRGGGGIHDVCSESQQELLKDGCWAIVWRDQISPIFVAFGDICAVHRDA